MTCEAFGNLVVCSPTAQRTERRVITCPTCKQRRRFVCTLYEWYGWLITCCACGDSWEDGERLPRPFKPRWREEAARKAKRQWAAA